MAVGARRGSANWSARRAGALAAGVAHVDSVGCGGWVVRCVQPPVAQQASNTSSLDVGRGRGATGRHEHARCAARRIVAVRRKDAGAQTAGRRRLRRRGVGWMYGGQRPRVGEGALRLPAVGTDLRVARTPPPHDGSEPARRALPPPRQVFLSGPRLPACEKSGGPPGRSASGGSHPTRQEARSRGGAGSAAASTGAQRRLRRSEGRSVGVAGGLWAGRRGRAGRPRCPGTPLPPAWRSCACARRSEGRTPTRCSPRRGSVRGGIVIGGLVIDGGRARTSSRTPRVPFDGVKHGEGGGPGAPTVLLMLLSGLCCSSCHRAGQQGQVGAHTPGQDALYKRKNGRAEAGRTRHGRTTTETRRQQGQGKAYAPWQDDNRDTKAAGPRPGAHAKARRTRQKREGSTKPAWELECDRTALWVPGLGPRSWS
eukprot:366488-Chlamydomonas_euryale.AAC.16